MWGTMVGLLPWRSVFEVTLGPHWDQVMNWTELGWKDFLRGTLRELEMGHVLEFCLIRDPVSGRYRMEVEEEEKTDEQLQRELDRKAKRLLALFEDETRWRINPSRPCLEMRGDSQCVIRWLTGRCRCRNEVYARRVRDMQNRLYDMCAVSYSQS